MRFRMLKLRSFAILLTVFCIQSCDQQDMTNSDKNYPTTYKKLDVATLSQMRKDFANTNSFLSSSITDFGFCGLLDNPLQTPLPTRIPDLSKAEAINATNSFISMNLKQLGIASPVSITFSRIDSFITYGGSVTWFFSSNLQKYDSLTVIDSYFNFILTNGKMTSCIGNWYPYIYIPTKTNINVGKAKSILLNKVVYIYDILGRPNPMTITAKSLETATFSKLIYPLKTTDKIELHFVWVVNIPDVFYVIYLDVMTGEIIGSYPTVIS